MVEKINDQISEAKLSESEIGRIGIGVPGILDLDLGTTLFLPNLTGTWPKVPKRVTIA
jgi:predicted NBD/HSP70 family sugar kinase